jgi:ribosome-binding protein aMBF1 (putative translation factor)
MNPKKHPMILLSKRLTKDINQNDGILTSKVDNTPKKVTETVQLIKNDYYAIIKKAREKKGLTREELGFKIGERTVTIQTRRHT